MFQCEICCKEFSAEKYLKKHLERHMGQKKLVSFLSYVDLYIIISYTEFNTHSLTHTSSDSVLIHKLGQNANTDKGEVVT